MFVELKLKISTLYVISMGLGDPLTPQPQGFDGFVVIDIPGDIGARI